MATLRQLVNDRSDRLARAPEQLVTRVEKLQRGIFQRILGKLDQLKRTPAGAIERTAENLAKAAEITEELKGVLTGSEYLGALAQFAAEFDRAKATNDAILRKTFGEFTPSELSALTLATSKARAVELLAGATATTGFLEPLRGAIEQAVTAGSSWVETVQQMSRLIGGSADTMGKLAQHVKQVAWDALAVADRSYAEAVATDLGVEWYFYSGTELPTTREFCRDRMGKYWHESEIRAWASLDWDGKMQESTNSSTIFQNLGGWNCRHILVPVATSSVPAEDRARIA